MITNETLVKTAKDAVRHAQEELADALSMISHAVAHSTPKGAEKSIPPAVDVESGIINDLGEAMSLLSSISASLVTAQKLAKDGEDERDKPYRLCGKEEKKRRLIDCGRWVEGEMEWCLTSYKGDGLEDGEWDWRYFDKRSGGHVYGE
jgi:hypothetical protein